MKNDLLKCVRFQHNDGKRVNEKASLYAPFSTGSLSRYIFPILDVSSELRATVCKNRAKSKCRGHSQKIVFAHILSIVRY